MKETLFIYILMLFVNRDNNIIFCSKDHLHLNNETGYDNQISVNKSSENNNFNDINTYNNSNWNKTYTKSKSFSKAYYDQFILFKNGNLFNFLSDSCFITKMFYYLFFSILFIVLKYLLYLLLKRSYIGLFSYIELFIAIYSSYLIYLNFNSFYCISNFNAHLFIDFLTGGILFTSWYKLSSWYCRYKLKEQKLDKDNKDKIKEKIS